MKSKYIIVTTVALALASSAFAANKPEDEIHYRQAVMTVVGRAFAPLISMAQGKSPYNADVVNKNTHVLETVIGLHWNSFEPGTDKGAPTRADPKIWTEPAKFKDDSQRVQQLVTKLSQAVKGGDEKVVKAAIGDVGKACKSCHDDFRDKDYRR